MVSWIPKLNRFWKQESNSASPATKSASESSDDSAKKAAESTYESTNDSETAATDESKADSDETSKKTIESHDEPADDSVKETANEKEKASEDRASRPKPEKTRLNPPSRLASLAPSPASLPPPLISTDAPAKPRNSSVSRIPSFSSSPARKTSVPPIPVTRSSLSGNPPSISLIGQANLERVRQDFATRFADLKKSLDANGQRIQKLADALETESKERTRAIEEQDLRIQVLEKGLKEEQDAWNGQVEERDEALFDLKLNMETEHNRLSDRLNDQNELVQMLESTVKELREKLEEFQRNAAEMRFSDVTGGDDLTRIKGVGPRFERALKNHGVTTYEQIASWTTEDIDRIASQIRVKPVRVQRERWVESARELIGTPE